MSLRFQDRIPWALALLLGALAAATPAAAAGPARDIEEARRLVDVELRFKEAIDVLERALGDPRITPKERVEAYLLMGIAYVARSATENAEIAFDALLDIEPDYELDAALSPKISRVFKRVKDRRARAPKILELTAIKQGDNVSFSARVSDADERLASVVLYTRAGGEPYREQIMDREGDRVRASVAMQGEPLRVEYYVVGKDAGGSAIARVSDAANPSAVIVEKPRIEVIPQPGPEDAPNAAPILAPPVEEETPFYGTWWFWTILAGTIAAGTTILVVTRGDRELPVGTLDPIQLE